MFCSYCSPTPTLTGLKKQRELTGFSVLLRLKGFIKLLQKILRAAMIGRTESPALRAANKLFIKKDVRVGDLAQR